MEKEKNPLTIEIPVEPEKKRRPKKVHRKYIFNILMVLVFTVGVLLFNLKDNFTEVKDALVHVDYRFIILLLGLFVFTIFIESLILFILARLYSARFTLGKGIGNALIGIFYNNVTPGQSGGQFAQAYTFTKQGIEISSSASILVMHYILKQLAMVTWGVLSLVFKVKDFLAMTKPIVLFGIDIPIIALGIFGFLINLLIIILIFILAYSKFFHEKIINGLIVLLGKMRIIRHPDRLMNNVNNQIENFRVEFKRLRANVPVSLTVYLLFMLRYLILFSLPIIAAMSIPTITLTGTLSDGIFMSSYLFVMTNMSPLPGSAGITELLFSYLFTSIMGGFANTIAPSLIWRTLTFYFSLIVSGITSAFYQAAPQEDKFLSDRKTFVALQRQTYAIRKLSSDTMWQTKQYSTQEFQNKLKSITSDFFGFKKRKLKKEQALKKKQAQIEKQKAQTEKQQKRITGEKLTLDTDEFLVDTKDQR